MGKSTYAIATELTNKGIPTPRGNKSWSQSTINSILTNEKYTGNAILQKTYTPDFLTKKRKTNNGEVPKYYVENSHEAIVTQEQYDIVQQELKNSNRRNCKGLFAGKLICFECGSTFGCKVWHSTDKYRCTIWRCNGKYAGNHKCSTPHLKEEDIKNAFVKALNKLPFNQKEVVSTLKESLSQILDTSTKEAELEHIEAEIVVTSELAKKSLSAPVTASSGEGSSGFDGYATKISELQKQHQELSDSIADIKHRKGLINQYLKELEKQENPISEFDENMFNSLVDHGTVYSDGHIVFTFNDESTLVS